MKTLAILLLLTGAVHAQPSGCAGSNCPGQSLSEYESAVRQLRQAEADVARLQVLVRALRAAQTKGECQ